MASFPIIFSVFFLLIFSLSSSTSSAKTLSFRPSSHSPSKKRQIHPPIHNRHQPTHTSSCRLHRLRPWWSLAKNISSPPLTNPLHATLPSAHALSQLAAVYASLLQVRAVTTILAAQFQITLSSGEIATDVVSIHSTDGSNLGQVVKIPDLVLNCGATFLLKGLAQGSLGIAGMGRHNVGLPLQLAAAFSLKRKFAICLSSGRGVAFFGNVSYNFLPGIEISQLTTTPLLINPVSTATAHSSGEKSSEYFIGITDIKISDKSIMFNKTILNIDGVTGFGGTKISTVDPYTVMETSIFNAFTSAFITEAVARNITRVSSVKPFRACFTTANVGITRVGYAVPEIQLVLQSKDVVWRIFGGNSMVSVGGDVICLGFVDGGVNARTSVVIGGLQLEDNLMEFDLASNRLGFSSTLLGRRTSCANFNFTSTA